MLLATGSAFDLVQFIRILCWILLPLFIIASLITIFLHYRNKRRNRKSIAHLDEAFLNASPELLGYTRGDGEYVEFDHSAAVGEYKKRLASNHAKYTALQYDYEKLTTKFMTLAAYTSTLTQANQKGNSDAPQLLSELLGEIDGMAASHLREKTELLNRFDYLSKSFQSLEQEHRSALEKLSDAETSTNNLQHIQQRLSAELGISQEETRHLKILLQEREIQLNELQHTSASQQQTVLGLQQSLEAANMINSSLSALVSEQEELIASLESLKSDEAVTDAGVELSVVVNEPADPPVIEMSAYLKRETEEVLAQ